VGAPFFAPGIPGKPHLLAGVEGTGVVAQKAGEIEVCTVAFVLRRSNRFHRGGGFTMIAAT
jgi:hypothetical protein